MTFPFSQIGEKKIVLLTCNDDPHKSDSQVNMDISEKSS